jgi:hypothetical protein
MVVGSYSQFAATSTSVVRNVFHWAPRGILFRIPIAAPLPDLHSNAAGMRSVADLTIKAADGDG